MTDSAISAAILGAAGYGGGELLRLLHQHRVVTGLQAVSQSHAGQPWHTAHPRLRGFVEGRYLDAVDWPALARSPKPVLFSAQGNGALAGQWPAIKEMMSKHDLADRLTVIDLSADFRLADGGQYEAAYGQVHPCPEALSHWVYGLSEHAKEALTGARFIANPGCFATAIQLALRPLLMLEAPEWIAINGVTGSSGSGVHPSTTTHHPDRANDYRAYKALSHPHAVEIRTALADLGVEKTELAFVPHSAPMVRGIFITLQARVREETAKQLSTHYERYYAHAPFIRLLSTSPRINHVLGNNACHIQVQSQGRQIVITAALDNLIKGMAGQAVQNMNLALGLPPTEGLFQP